MNNVICPDEQLDTVLPDNTDNDPNDKPIFDLIKRIFDITASSAAIILLSPFMLIIMAVISLEDLGSPFFCQERIGKNGKPFKIYKFRSMQKNADKIKDELMKQSDGNGANFKMEHDPRITKVGNILRKTSLDELPQLINILKGDMSVIGPRPFISSEQDELPDDRLAIRPGLSCYWQISGKNALTTQEQIDLDRKYIEERSVIVDLKIIFRTVVIVFTGKNG